MVRNEKSGKQALQPADLDIILESYEDILQSYQNHKDKNSIYGTFKKTNRKLEVLFLLKEHPIHGITGIHAVEKYNEKGFVKIYHYQWKRIIPKEGIANSHISAWENEPHANKNIPTEFVVKTEPNHHHHIPGERKKEKKIIISALWKKYLNLWLII